MDEGKPVIKSQLCGSSAFGLLRIGKALDPAARAGRF